MDDEAEGRTYAECEAAFHRAKETTLDAHLSRKAAVAIRNSLKARGLDFPKWDRFIESLPADKNGSAPPPPETPPEPAAEDPLRIDQVIGLRSSPVECAPTEFEPIDTRLRGRGLPRGLLGCIAGAPEAGKTRLLCQLGLGLAKTMPVVMLTSDWGRSAGADIMAVMLGFDPKLIDVDPQAAREWVHVHAPKTVFFCPDGWSVPQAFDFADTMGHSAILLDSAQNVSCEGIPGFDKAPTFEQNRVLARYLRSRIASKGSRQPHTCLFTSEVSQAAFASKSLEERSADIASPRGGNIGYASDLLLAIHRPDGDTEQRALVFAKNRYRPFLGYGSRILTVDYTPDGRLLEVSPEAAKAAEASAYETTILPVKRVIREVLAQGRAESFRALRERVKIADRSITDARFREVLSVMTRIDKSVQEGDGPNRATTYTLAYQDDSEAS